MTVLIELDKITKSYLRADVKTDVLHGISLQIQAGELVAIIGTSGSGKSTLMHIIGLLDRPTTGDYCFDGKNIATCPAADLAQLRNSQIGFIFQSFFLLPAMTVLENVGLPLTYQELPDKLIAAYAHEALRRVGLDHLAHRLPNQLSGGQQQRVAIARALVAKPNVVLADEPTGALDSKAGQEIMDLFIQLNTADHNTIIIVTHNTDIANQCSRIIEIHDGLIQTGGRG